jgi:MSHA biogenesis protein MshK
MAGGMRPPLLPGWLCAAAAALTVCVLPAAAWSVDDPTRPPAELRTGVALRSTADELVLQSVIISPSSRSAIINGEHVMLGGRIGAARLVKVSEGAVVVLVGSSQRRLELYPGVRKQYGAHAPAEQ